MFYKINKHLKGLAAWFKFHKNFQFYAMIATSVLFVMLFFPESVKIINVRKISLIIFNAFDISNINSHHSENYYEVFFINHHFKVHFAFFFLFLIYNISLIFFFACYRNQSNYQTQLSFCQFLVYQNETRDKISEIYHLS